MKEKNMANNIQAGYLSNYTGAQVDEAVGRVPTLVSDVANISDTLNNLTLSALNGVTITNPTQGQNLTYDSTNRIWKNTSSSAQVGWGGITGTLSDQTDLYNALEAKTVTVIRNWESE